MRKSLNPLLFKGEYTEYTTVYTILYLKILKRKLMRFYQIRNDENEGIIPNWLWQSLSQSGSPLDTNRPSQLRKYRLVSSGPMGARPTGFDVVNDISRRFDFLAKSVIEALKPKAMQTKAFGVYSK